MDQVNQMEDADMKDGRGGHSDAQRRQGRMLGLREMRWRELKSFLRASPSRKK
jgi:hypothetical protein